MVLAYFHRMLETCTTRLQPDCLIGFHAPHRLRLLHCSTTESDKVYLLSTSRSRPITSHTQTIFSTRCERALWYWEAYHTVRLLVGQHRIAPGILKMEVVSTKLIMYVVVACMNVYTKACELRFHHNQRLGFIG